MCPGLDRSFALKKKRTSGWPASRSTREADAASTTSAALGSLDMVQPVSTAVGLEEPSFSATSVGGTKPLVVANQRVPSGVRVEVGLDAPPHSLERMPSALPRMTAESWVWLPLTTA